MYTLCRILLEVHVVLEVLEHQMFQCCQALLVDHDYQ